MIKETRSTVRDISGDTYKAFKKVNIETAKTNMEDASKQQTTKENKELKTQKIEKSRQPRADQQRN